MLAMGCTTTLLPILINLSEFWIYRIVSLILGYYYFRRCGMVFIRKHIYIRT